MYVIYLILSSMVGVSFTLGKGRSGTGMPRNCLKHLIFLFSKNLAALIESSKCIAINFKKF